MDFAFSPEQQMLAGQARSLLEKRFTAERLAAVAEGEGWDAGVWSEICGLGWVGLSAPEESGGAGMSFLDEAVLFEETGYALFPGPYFATVGLALPALATDADALAAVVSGEGPATLAWAESDTALTFEAVAAEARPAGDEWVLSGTKRLVPDLAAASYIVVTATGPDGPGLWRVVQGEGCRAVVSKTVDPTRAVGELELDDAPARLLAHGDEAVRLLASIRARALAAVSLEAVGIAQKALDLAKAYVSERKQFDRPIGSYQAVSHQVANVYMDVELARSLAYWTAWSVAEDEQAALAASAAKAFAGQAAVAACERCIQVHGGIGFTWEHVIHRYYKRALWIDAFDAPAAAHRALVADAVLGS